MFIGLKILAGMLWGLLVGRLIWILYYRNRSVPESTLLSRVVATNLDRTTVTSRKRKRKWRAW